MKMLRHYLNSLSVVVEYADVLVGVVKFLVLLALMHGSVGCRRVV